MRRIEVVAWMGYITFAMGFTALSAALPFLRGWLHTGYATLSFLLLAWALGNTVGYFGANALVDRIGSPRILRVGLLAFGAGYVVLIFAHVLIIWLAVLALVGMGVSLIDVASARLVAHLHRPEPGRALNRLNVFFGLGAILGPLAMSVSLKLVDSPVPVFLILVAFAALSLWMLGTLMTIPFQVAVGAVGPKPAPIWHVPWVWRLGLATFLYIAAEVGFGTWVSPFAFREAHVSAAIAALFPMVFWGGLMVTRIIASAPGNRLALGGILIGGSIAGAAMSVLALVLSHWAIALLAAAFLVGASFGPMFPLFLAVASQRAPDREGSVYAVLYIAVALASLLVPWGEGQIFSRVPYLTVAITPAVSLVMAVVLWHDGQANQAPGARSIPDGSG